MEETTPQSSPEPIRSEDIAKAIAAKRKRMREFSRRQIERLGTIESQMSSTLEQISDELARERRNLTSQQQLLADRTAQLQRQSEDGRPQEALNAAYKERDALAEQLSNQQADLRKAQSQLKEIRNQFESAQSKLAESEQRASEFEEQLDNLRQENARIQNEVKKSREQGNAEGAELGDLQMRLAQAEADRDALQHRLASPTDDGSQNSELFEQIESLKSERDTLTQLLTEAEQQLTQAGKTDGAPAASSEELEDLQRRHEMTLDDLRELKTKNADLEKRLAAARAAKNLGGGDNGGTGMDWESQKRRMLAQLESEFDEGNEEEKAAKLEIEAVIDITDTVAAEKDREIQELKQLLDQQSSNLGSVAVGAAAFADMLDKDEVVRQERERLQLLQAEWEEKLRQAEIDLSLQRAKIARERLELEDKQRNIDQQKSDQADTETDGNGAGKSKKPQKGRWLSRLGLKDNEES